MFAFWTETSNYRAFLAEFIQMFPSSWNPPYCNYDLLVIIIFLF